MTLFAHVVPVCRCAVLAAALLGLDVRAAPPKFGDTWPESAPEELGLSGRRLEGAWRVLELNQTTTFLVIRSDHVVFERYAPGFSRTTPRDTASLARALVGGLGLLAAESEGYVRPTGAGADFSLRDTPDRDLTQLIRERILRRIGVPDAEWSAGDNGPVAPDGLSLTGTGNGANFSPNAAARVGRLLARRGDWDEEQVIPFEVATAATRHAERPNVSSRTWWANRRSDGSRVLARAPDDAFWGLGAGGQLLFVVPSLDLIVVRNGAGLPADTDELRMMEKLVVNPVLDAFVRETKAPYPPSRFISEIRWAPASSVIRLAPGGDNWPSTGGDDGQLYTAYGDGNGFAPFTGKKLSLGFARVAGCPPALTPANLRSPTGEQEGDGRRGRKASGLLMVDGTLYMLVRNAGNAQLAWSEDRGATWQWSDWKFSTSFGCPAFVNFGANYAGARDDYVYILSPDAGTAYDRADRLVLARVPRQRLRDPAAYEYFVRRDVRGEAVWSRDIAQCGGIFENPGACYRSHVTYDAGLKRYLLTTIGRGADTRYAGGFGIYDAPEPWGPWTTVFHTDTWDIGPGESSHFPAQWLDADGRGGWLLFSGDDAFSVRRAEFVPGPAAAR